MKRSHRMSQTVGRWISQSLVLGPLVFVLVAGSGCPSLFESSQQRATRVRQAEVGRDGPKTVTDLDTIVNDYAALNAGAARDATSITVQNIDDLATRFTTPLAKGDLILIIQMAGATINSADDTSAYGSITDLGNAGRYEFAGVESVTGNQITLACPLKNDYTGPSGKAQVIRVPQYTILTIEMGASITAQAWDGTAGTGGVVAVHAETTLQLGGQINASAKGFRGGAVDNSSAAYPSNVVIYRSGVASRGAEKGEGIAGDATAYDALDGRYGRGAPANGGGGGDAHNAGGGGGANARHGAAWTGQGVMLSTVTGASAWQYDPGYIDNPAGANTLTTSEGGGRGGYSYSAANLDATAASGAPGLAGWNGDRRREAGGLGGRPLDNDPTSRLFMGGGGGAGDGNNSQAGRGGSGGGIVFVIAGAITGNGRIVASGEAGANSAAGAGGSDGPGGGGGGGTVVIHAVTIASSISVVADGGPGGNQTGSSSNEAEGPGGGGGGGYIAVSGGTPSLSAAGGPGGTTRANGPLSEFPSNGATAGNAGQTDGDATSFLYCGVMPGPDMPDTTIETYPPDPTVDPIGSFTFSSNEGGVTFECDLDGEGWQPCDASYTTPILGDARHSIRVRAIDLSGNVDSSPAIYEWDVIAGIADGGVLDSGVIDTGVFDSGEIDTGEDAGAALDVEDATVGIDEGVDASGPDTTAEADVALADAGDDVIAVEEVGGPDLAPDIAIIGQPDTPPIQVVDAVVDVAPDEQADAVATVDLGSAIDGIDGATGSLDGTGEDLSSDADALGPDLGPDTAPLPEPNPDTAAPVPAEDAAAPSGNDDAAQTDPKLVVLGGGFCAIAPPRAPSSAAFALLALVGLAVLRRRRTR
jgi:MYXO-CTERM domain-containing protein